MSLLLDSIRANSRIKNSVERVFNVKDYKAKGDGTTDDSAAIQAAIDAANAAGGGVVYIPDTTSYYAIGDQIVLKDNVALVGGGGIPELRRSAGDVFDLSSATEINVTSIYVADQDVATQTNLYGADKKGIRRTLREGTAANGVDVKDPVFYVEKYIDLDYDTGGGNIFDQGTLYHQVQQVGGDAFFSTATFSSYITSGSGTGHALHARARTNDADSGNYALWGYLHNQAGSGAVCELNINNDDADQGYQAGFSASREVVGLNISTADSSATPSTWGMILSAQKNSANVTSTGIAFVDSNPDTITISSGFSALSGSPYVRISGSSVSANNKIVKVASITDTIITLDASESITAQSAGDSITIERWQNRGFYCGWNVQPDAIEAVNGSGNGEIARWYGASKEEYAYKGIRFENFYDSVIETHGATLDKGVLEMAKGQTLAWGGDDTTGGAYTLTLDSSDIFKFSGDGTAQVAAPYNGNSATAPQFTFGVTGGGVDSNTGFSRTTGDNINVICNGTNIATFADSQLAMRGPIDLQSYTVAQLGALSSPSAGWIAYCTDETGGAIPVFYDGTNWRRMSDRAVVS